MEYQKVMNLLDNTPNQPSKSGKKNWVEINDDARGTYRTNSQIKFKNSIVKSSCCDYSDAYILAKRTISIATVPPPPANSNNTDKEVKFKNFALFADCISETNNTQIDNAEDIDVVMSLYNLTEYSNNYSKTSGNLWQYYRGELVLTDPGFIANFHAANNSALFQFKQKKTVKAADGGTKYVEVMAPLKYFNSFWITLDMYLISCENNLI